MEQTSIVFELQRLASDSGTKVTQALRKALVVAAKLKIADFEKWINSELGGYSEGDTEVPRYRRTRGELLMPKPFGGSYPVHFTNRPELRDILQNVLFKQPIAALEEMLGGDSSGVTVSISVEMSEKIVGWTNDEDMRTLYRFVPRSGIVAIVEAVKTIVLQWSLQLEKQGILGAGMAFSPAEQARASESPNIHIENFQGVIGDVHTENLQIGDFPAIYRQLKEAGVSQFERNELENIMDEIKHAKTKPERAPLLQRGMDWLARNAKNIGPIAEVIKKWLESHHI